MGVGRGQPRDPAAALSAPKTLPPEEFRELCVELMRESFRIAVARPADTRVVPKKLWDAEEHKAWLRQTWGSRRFTAGEVQEMKDAEDGLID